MRAGRGEPSTSPGRLRPDTGLVAGGPAWQRLSGLLVLLVVAVAALVVAQLLHPPVAGSATRGPVPGPPAVGDCLLDPTVIAARVLIGPAPKHPWLRTGPCQGRRFGEVAAVLTKHDLPAPTPASSQPGTGPNSGNDTVVLDPYSWPCYEAVTVWVGLPSPTGPQIFDRWLTGSLAVGVVLSGPNQIQSAAGQDWVACIAAGNNWGTAIPDAGAIGHDTIGYDTTTRGIFSPGPPPSTFALCTPTTSRLPAPPPTPLNGLGP